MDTDRCRTDAQTCGGCMTKLAIIVAVVRAPAWRHLPGPPFRLNSPRLSEMNNIAYRARQADSTPAV
jgi:hypothetical protein